MDLLSQEFYYFIRWIYFSLRWIVNYLTCFQITFENGFSSCLLCNTCVQIQDLAVLVIFIHPFPFCSSNSSSHSNDEKREGFRAWSEVMWCFYILCSFLQGFVVVCLLVCLFEENNCNWKQGRGSGGELLNCFVSCYSFPQIFPPSPAFFIYGRRGTLCVSYSFSLMEEKQLGGWFWVNKQHGGKGLSSFP